MAIPATNRQITKSVRFHALAQPSAAVHPQCERAAESCCLDLNGHRCVAESQYSSNSILHHRDTEKTKSLHNIFFLSFAVLRFSLCLYASVVKK